MRHSGYLIVIALAGLPGCDVTTFDAPPIGESACDTRLVGDWYSVADPHGSLVDGLELKIDEGCASLTAIQHDEHGWTPPQRRTPFHVGHDGNRDFAWVELKPLQLEDPAREPTSTDQISASTDANKVEGIFLARYSVGDNRLEFYVTDDRAIEHRIIDGKVFGEVDLRSHRKLTTLWNRIDANMTPDEFRREIVFLPKPWRFERRGQVSTK